MKQETQDAIEKFCQAEMDRQCDDAEATVLFGGNQIVLSSRGRMSGGEWRDLGEEFCALISREFYVQYEIGGCAREKEPSRYVTLRSVEDHCAGNSHE